MKKWVKVSGNVIVVLCDIGKGKKLKFFKKYYFNLLVKVFDLFFFNFLLEWSGLWMFCYSKWKLWLRYMWM